MNNVEARLDDSVVPGERALALVTTSPEGKVDRHFIPVSVLAERMELLGVDEEEALRVIIEDEPTLDRRSNPYVETWQALLGGRPMAERAQVQVATRAKVARPGLDVAAGRAPFNPIVQMLLDALTQDALDEGRRRFAEMVRQSTAGKVDLDAR